MIILANDGISPSGKEALENAGFSVVTETVAQENLIDYINKNEVSVLLVRSATTVRENLIDACPSLKIIGRGGVGMDNIDVAYAREKGLKVINTPAASSTSVAELVFGSLFGVARSLHLSNRAMPTKGATEFKVLKKAYAKGLELRGKTLGIIGFGRIGQELAKYALGCGMKVVFHTRNCDSAIIPLYVEGYGTLEVELKNTSLQDVVSTSDFISVHVPAQADGSAVIGAKEIALMKDGVIVANTARGGSIDETALLEGLESGKIAGAVVDVFVGEPKPQDAILNHPKISLTPHIGAATEEAQDRIGVELADQIKAELLVNS